MKYYIEPRGNYFVILREDSDCCVGSVSLHGGRYEVSNANCDDIAIVDSINQAIPALAAYYNANPPRWERESPTRYTKLTQFGQLTVEQDPLGQWLAYRCDDLLLRNDKPAIFTTLTDAQRVADVHFRDNYPNSGKNNDGYSWPLNPDTAAWFASRDRGQRSSAMAGAH
jgi:hypothetical protein